MASTKWRDVFESEDNLQKKKNILNEEIEYGLSLRKDRIMEKQILLAPDEDSLVKDDNLIPPNKLKKKKKKKKKRKPAPLCQKLSAEKVKINRNACSRKEYYDLMSQPRPSFCPAEQIKIKTKLKTWSPRFAQLAIPLKQRIFNTWQDYYRVLSPEQVLGLQLLMNKEEALAPKDASDYFKNLDRQKKIEKRKKLKKQKQEVVKKPQKTKIKKEINSLAKILMKTFTEKGEATVKCAHVMMTEIIKKKLEEENLLPAGTKRSLENDVYSQTLYETLDQLCVWLLSNISFDDLELDEEEQKEASSVSTFSSITYSDVSTIRSAVSEIEEEVILVEEKLEPVEGELVEELEEEESAIEREMEELGAVAGEGAPLTAAEQELEALKAEGEEAAVAQEMKDEAEAEAEVLAKIEEEGEVEAALEGEKEKGGEEGEAIEEKEGGKEKDGVEGEGGEEGEGEKEKEKESAKVVDDQDVPAVGAEVEVETEKAGEAEGEGEVEKVGEAEGVEEGEKVSEAAKVGEAEGEVEAEKVSEAGKVSEAEKVSAAEKVSEAEKVSAAEKVSEAEKAEGEVEGEEPVEKVVEAGEEGEGEGKIAPEKAVIGEEVAEGELVIQAEGAGEELPELIESLLLFPKEGAEGEEMVITTIAPEEMAKIKEAEAEILELHKEILEEMGSAVFPGDIQPKSASEVEEHSPDAMCCVTIKTWAKWLVDVSHNTYHWSQWIQDVISRVRLFVAVIRGEVMNPDGKPRKLYKEEWIAFTEMLDKDIDSWKKYNEHVKTISEKIIAEFQNKRFICCPACLQSKIIISEETAHQVTDDLVNALNTSTYFRDWLDAIVAEAKKFRDLKFELPPAPGDLDGSSGSSFGMFELIEIKSPDTITKGSNSSGSVFVIEEVNSNKKL